MICKNKIDTIAYEYYSLENNKIKNLRDKLFFLIKIKKMSDEEDSHSHKYEREKDLLIFSFYPYHNFPHLLIC